MPDILISNSWPPIAQKVYWRAATLACIELGIDHYDATIRVLRAKLPRGTNAGLVKISPNKFELPVMWMLNPGKIIHALGHELVHFGQFMRGDLDEFRSENQTDSKVFWKGVEYHVNLNTPVTQMEKQAYLAMPWELEAFNRHDKIFDVVVRQIETRDRIELFRETDAEIRKLMLTSFVESIFGERSRVSRDLVKALTGEKRHG